MHTLKDQLTEISEHIAKGPGAGDSCLTFGSCSAFSRL